MQLETHWIITLYYRDGRLDNAYAELDYDEMIDTIADFDRQGLQYTVDKVENGMATRIDYTAMVGERMADNAADRRHEHDWMRP